ncbi:SHOCT domain-containing protein [Puerhibacterium puerhi]|uniref:SHOCT domain-containing protein n=1 Tax=Puerhibacterium puerhi TaxID=2692623 RepID=UPI0013575BE8|nr:SHOCT domain-containing protein [Puerhibacterium puerhi]
MPGLLRGVARTAVIAGTASAVSGRVQRRQQGRWAEQDAQRAQAAGYPPQYAQPQYPQPQYAPAPEAPTGGETDPTIAQLRQLAELRDQGVLTDAEFAAQKARILGG